uniref:Mediator of RNA polymerase II transcription subunit 20 n=1 Tax=Calcidiscus leptoporus TaxID=127549 RepID=A0A7S0P1D4_9EUKA
MSLLTYSVEPQYQYVVSEGRCVRAGEGMGAVLESLGTHTRGLEASAKGSVLEVGDFVVRVGVLFLNSNVSEGTVIEIEYKPCADASAGGALLREFLWLLLDAARVLHAGGGAPANQVPASPDPYALEALGEFAPDFVAEPGSLSPDFLPRAFSRQHAALQFDAMLRKLTRAE